MNNEVHLKTWNAYQRAWGPVDETEREELLRASVSEDILYTDPSSQTRGLQELFARIGQSQQKFTGAYFKNDSFLEHHDQALFLWTMYDAEDRVFVKGSSFGHFGADGRLVQATGFFEVPTKRP
ncbi:nuclear transport factor 2 family protein [Bradyrhizobium diazoefficiens]|uniref:nuclear transport factor 2 family protein n=1 Tax=Bradyrhizobium diazoefficiens TaxID=1355477 RepID=UPI00190C2FE3|nr:nuclear transport factor 2 family protein [Bradyrhizobium diazoefficiens]MBK3662217.1 nuclear transport factor 2 family protein [Bradyrhizobium diazoefficiens]